MTANSVGRSVLLKFVEVPLTSAALIGNDSWKRLQVLLFRRRFLLGTSEKPAKLALSPRLRLAGERSATAGFQRLRTGLRQEEDAAADLPRRDGSHHPLG